MKKIKKAFVWLSVAFTILVIAISAATTLLVNHLDTVTTTRTLTCYSDGTHCVYDQDVTHSKK